MLPMLMLGVVRLSFVALALLLSPARAEAQFEAAAGARVLGLGGAGVALRGYGLSAALNPAGLEGLPRSSVVGALGAGLEPGFFNSFVRPGALAVAWPRGRLTISALAAEGHYETSQGAIAHEFFSASFSRRLHVDDLIFGIGMRAASWLSLGAGLGLTRLDVDDSYASSGSVRGTPVQYEARQLGTATDRMLRLGLLLHRGDRVGVGFVWRSSANFSVPYARLESFPNQNLAYPVSGHNEFHTPAEWRIGASVRPSGGFLLLADYANSGREFPIVSFAICAPRPSPVPREYCVPQGPDGFSVGLRGERLHLGAEHELKIGSVRAWLRGGYEAAWLTYSDTEHAGTFGVGFSFGQRLGIDAAGRYGFTSKRHQVVLSGSVDF